MKNPFLWVKIAFAVVIIYALSKTGVIDFRLVATMWGHGPVLGVAALCFFAGIIISGLRWDILLRAAGFHFRIMTVLRLQWIGSLFSTFLPGAAGGDAIRIAYLCRLLDQQRTTGLLVLVVDRLFSLFGLVALTGLLLLWSHNEIIAHPLLLSYGKWIAGALALAFVVAGVVYLVALHLRIPVMPLSWLERLRPFLRQIRAAVLLYAKQWPSLIVVAILSVVASATVALGIVVLSKAFAFAPSMHIAALAGTLGNISSSIPLTPGGIGIGEAMFAKVCEDLGNGIAPYATIYLAFRIIMALVSLTGIFAYIGFDPERNRPASISEPNSSLWFRASSLILQIQKCYGAVINNGFFTKKFVLAKRAIQARPRLSAVLLACLAVSAAFPDVVFRWASIMVTDQIEGAIRGMPTRSIFPYIGHREWWGFYADNGGSLWQFEPMLEFMRYCLHTLNSPYWNPYSSAGALGPETLVDLKFSAFTLAYALLGGGSLVYNLLMLGFFAGGGYCLLRILRDKLGLSTIASFAAAGFYMMNGYAVANSGSNVFISYLFIPLCLLTSMNYIERPSAARFARLALAFVLLLSFSFIPTTLMTVITIFGCSAGYAFAQGKENTTPRRLAMILWGHVLAVVAAFGVLAVLFLPMAESLAQTGMLHDYEQRRFFPAFLSGVLSLFTSSHFFESYNAMEATAQSFLKISTPTGGFATYPIPGNTVYHFGVVGLLMAACGLTVRNHRWRWVIVACVAVIGFGIGRIFAVPGFSQIVDIIPVLRNIGCQYWWVTLAIPLMFLVAFGFDNLEKNRSARLPVAIMIMIGLASALYIGFLYGLREPHVVFKLASLSLSAFLAVAVALAVWGRRPAFLAKIPWQSAIVLTLFMLLELTISGKQTREPAADIFSNPPVWANYLRTNIGPYRTLTIGSNGLMGERGAAYQIPEVTSLSAGTLPDYTRYFNRVVTLATGQYMGGFVSLSNMQDTPEKNKFDWQAVDLLGVKYVTLPPAYINYRQALLKQGFRMALQDPFLTIMENPYVLPRAFTLVLKSTPLEESLTLPDGFRKRITPAEIVTYRNAEVDMKGVASTPRLLVLTDNWHPNWSATVNGNPAPIIKINGIFRGVWIPAGEFKVVMTYRPKTLTVAILLSLLCFIFLIWLIFVKEARVYTPCM